MNNDDDTKPNTEKQPAPNTRKLSLSEKAVVAIGDRFLPQRDIPQNQRLKQLTDDQKAELQKIEDNAIVNFVGNVDELESALGMLRIGHHIGWKVLYLVHSKKTIRKYEEILEIKIREVFDERGPSTDRSIGLGLAEKFSNFWKVVSGDKDHKIDTDKRKQII